MRRGRARRSRGGWSQLDLLGLGLVVVPRDRVLELTHPAAERATHLGKALGAEDQQEDEDDHQGPLPTDVSRHVSDGSTVLNPGTPWVSRYTGSVTSSREAARNVLGKAVTNLALLEIKDLHVATEDGTEIVRGVDLSIDTNQVHAIMGPNGSGKSTLASALMGHPAYEITGGDVLLDGESILELEADERAQRGLFLAFQYPHAVPGGAVASFLGSSLDAARTA